MSTIIDFPGADRPITEGQIDKLHSEAFRDLEGRISDCLWMSVIALEMVERALEGREDKHDKAMFAVFEAAKRLKQLKVDYYAAYYGESRWSRSTKLRAVRLTTGRLFRCAKPPLLARAALARRDAVQGRRWSS